MTKRMSAAALCMLVVLSQPAFAAQKDDVIATPQAWRAQQSVVNKNGASGATISQALAQPGYEVEQGQWWTLFGDEKLNAFVTSVIKSNNRLAAAAVSAKKARLQAGLTVAQTGPQVSADVRGEKPTSVGGSDQITANAAMSYEVDLWGRVGATRSASKWEAQATEEDRHATALSLAGSAVQLYWQLALLNLQAASAQESVAYAERTKALVDAQYAAGAVSGLEVNDAEQTLQSQNAALTQLIQSRVEKRNAIAALRNGKPLAEADEPNALPDTLPEIEAGAPVDILGRRPDLRAAELRLRKTLAEGQATRASYYPSLALTASGGGSSTSLANLLTNPASAIAAALTLPFLQINEMTLASRISRADYEQASLTFRQTLQDALVEVENALSARSTLAVRDDQLRKAFTAASTSEQLYEARYRAGAATLRDWLDSQERRRQAQLSFQQNRADELNNRVTLFLALGGGD